MNKSVNFLFTVILFAWILIDGQYINTKQIICIDQAFMGVTTIHLPGQSKSTIATQKSKKDIIKMIIEAERKIR